MKTIYRCDNCEFEMNETDSFCSKCGGMVWKDYIGTATTAELYDKDDPRMCHYLHVIPFFYKTNKEKELGVLNELISRLPEYKENLRIQKKEELNTLLQYKKSDIAKVQIIEPNSKNIKIEIIDKDKYMNNPLFTRQEDKKEIFWFTPYDDNNMEQYVEIIKDTIKHIDEFEEQKKTR